MEPGIATTILPLTDDAEVIPSSYLSPEGAIFARYQKAVLRYTGTVVPDTPENRATAIRCHDQGLSFQEAGILQAMTLVKNGMANPAPALKEAVDGLPPERLALMHRIWREGVAPSDHNPTRSNSKAMVIMAVGAVFIISLVGWAGSIYLPGTNGSVEESPASIPTPKPQKPAIDSAKSVAPTNQTRLSEAQGLLKGMGLYENKVDGIYGPGTKAALKAFQARYALEQTGNLDDTTFHKLRDAAGK